MVAKSADLKVAGGDLLEGAGIGDPQWNLTRLWSCGRPFLYL